MLQLCVSGGYCSLDKRITRVVIHQYAQHSILTTWASYIAFPNLGLDYRQLVGVSSMLQLCVSGGYFSLDKRITRVVIHQYAQHSILTNGWCTSSVSAYAAFERLDLDNDCAYDAARPDNLTTLQHHSVTYTRALLHRLHVFVIHNMHQWKRIPPP